MPGGVPDRAVWLACGEWGPVALSAAVLREFEDALARPKFASRVSQEARADLIARVRNAGVLLEPAVRVAECRDPRDDKYLELALAAQALAVVTGDADLLVLYPWRGVRMITPRQFLALAEAG